MSFLTSQTELIKSEVQKLEMVIGDYLSGYFSKNTTFVHLIYLSIYFYWLISSIAFEKMETVKVCIN